MGEEGLEVGDEVVEGLEAGEGEAAGGEFDACSFIRCARHFSWCSLHFCYQYLGDREKHVWNWVQYLVLSWRV